MRGQISHQRVLEDFQDLPIQHYPHTVFLNRVFDLKDNLTAYDALYLVLAETLEAELLTRDSAFGQYNTDNRAITVIQ